MGRTSWVEFPPEGFAMGRPHLIDSSRNEMSHAHLRTPRRSSSPASMRFGRLHGGCDDRLGAVRSTANG
ncbi:hypothetical protein RHGRI_002217 [Rhododendron griersonianum]|uniref:Uncharacterized protein n=1 Tax=Rhododendron griersonianum TaxID=479676 RepID=A0AAV6LNR9_9ERIC|nr:hypothetical protein RHGRI_002217 [Rhododendron griersonianum]